ncbi:MAG: Response regulator PleD [Candidatus Izimaplasma bacterium HR2]|nr:MAG: Response regulator PleD [Candidatus Izimaplasma bacterium HR2]
MYDKKYLELLSYLYEGVYVVDQQRKIVFWNKGSEEITGYSAEEVTESYCYNNILRHVTEDGKNLCFDGCPLHHTLATGELQEADVFLHHKEGHRIPVKVKSIPIYDSEENIVAAIEVFTDERYKKDTYSENRKLKELLVTDPLTKISNRRYLDFHLESCKKEADEFETTFGLLFFDIDKFKGVNDTYGHDIGDEILKLMSRTISSNIRGDDKVGRWGGEEFIAVIKIDHLGGLEKIANKLRLLVSKSEHKLENDKELRVTVSIGGTLYKPGESLIELVKRADSYMYQAKEKGRNRVIVK